jgi:circadian clock protein KaiC
MVTYMSHMAFYDAAFLPASLQYVSGFGVLEREGLPGLLKLMQHEIKRHQATAVVLDGIFVAHSNVTEAEYRKFVHELQGVAAYLDAVLLILTHQDRPAHSPEHTMVDGWIELRDELKAFRSYRTVQVRKHRGSAMMAGRHLFKIGERGLSVFPRLETTLTRGTNPPAFSSRAPTGVAGLDEITGGGLLDPSATLVLGPTGAGKTTLGLHFIHEATPEAPAIMLGFYESPERLATKAKSAGLDLQDAIASGAVRILWCPPSENSVDELAWKLIRLAEETGAKRVLIDGIVALRENLIAPERLPQILSALNARLAELGASVLYTGEVREMHAPDKLPSDQISLFVENLIILSYMRQENVMRRTLSVLKLRDSGFDPRTHEYHIGGSGIRFGPDPLALNAEA